MTGGCHRCGKYSSVLFTFAAGGGSNCFECVTPAEWKKHRRIRKGRIRNDPK